MVKELATERRSVGAGDRVADPIDPDRAWAAFQPTAERPWTRALAGHLYRRAAFGATANELRAALKHGPQATVNQLVRPPADLRDFDTAIDADEDAVARSGSLESARAWWLRRMIETPFPLRERMTLFWHNHFGISQARVKDVGLMVRHARMLRQHALSTYRPLLEAASQDPAVLLGVGADANRKAQPNEAFARQLMAQFSVGPGNFGEEDVHEAARAFTGWFVFRGRTKYLAREHDAGPKSVLGQLGQWNAADVVRMVLDQPATPQMLVRKLYRWFVSETAEPSADLLAPLVALMGNQHDVGRVVETILRSNLFFSATAYRQRVKSPVDFAVGIVRAMQANVPTVRLGADLAHLGQNLYMPPTLAGWPGATHWLNSATILQRANLAQALWNPKGPYGGKLNPAKLAAQYDQVAPGDAAKFLAGLFVQQDLADATFAKLRAGQPGQSSSKQVDPWLRQVAYRIVTLPEFQLS